MASVGMGDGSSSAPATTMNTSKPARKPERLPITVEKPTPYSFDLGHLLAQDPNPLDLPAETSSNKPALNTALSATARDGAQSLLNQLLTTCPVSTDAQHGVLLTLPAAQTKLPRFKPLPTPKAPTKWEKFARAKGIGKYNSKVGSSNEAERRKKMVYDEATGEWVPRWGYKGKNKAGDEDWLVEVDEKKWKKEGEMSAEGKSIRNEGRRERMEKIRRNERKMRANEARQNKGKGK